MSSVEGATTTTTTTSGDHDNSNTTEETMTNLRIDPSRAKILVSNLTAIQSRIQTAAAKDNNNNSKPVRLICVSKLKPANDILTLHQAPASCLHFGENYAQELTSKAKILPTSIRWHFIGGLQTNKCRPLAAEVKNLWCVSSVDTTKKADALDKGRGELRAQDGSVSKLKVQVQVNTSGEGQKSGTEPGRDTVELCRHVRDNCENLELTGLMTIGAIARSREGGENEDFVELKRVRDEVVKELSLDEGELELGMGMSADFESAIKLGSDEVRVGSSLFGERPPKSEAKLTTEGQQ